MMQQMSTTTLDDLIALAEAGAVVGPFEPSRQELDSDLPRLIRAARLPGEVVAHVRAYRELARRVGLRQDGPGSSSAVVGSCIYCGAAVHETRSGGFVYRDAGWVFVRGVAPLLDTDTPDGRWAWVCGGEHPS